MKIIATEKSANGYYELCFYEDDNGEFVITSELNGELFRTDNKERAEVRWYNIIMAKF